MYAYAYIYKSILIDTLYMGTFDFYRTVFKQYSIICQIRVNEKASSKLQPNIFFLLLTSTSNHKLK